MSNTITDTRIDARDMAVAFREIRQTVLRMLTVIENPSSTANEKQRACSTIRDAFELHEDPSRYGVTLAEYEANAAANHPSVDRLAGKLDSQEAAFAEKLRELMKARAMTQSEARIAHRMHATCNFANAEAQLPASKENNRQPGKCT